MAFLCEGANARVVARLATHTLGDGGGSGSWVGNAAVCCGTTDDSRRRAVLIPILSSTASGLTEGFDVYEWEYDHPEMHAPTIAQGEPCVSGGVPALYDGEHFSELCFHYYPFPYTDINDIADGGGLVAGETYQWVWVYEFKDSRGVIHRSVPSIVKEKTISGGDDTVTISIANLTLTERQTYENAGWEVRIVGYRTQAISSGDGAFYREHELYYDLVNDPESDWVTYTSNIADSTLAKQEILYTDGGVAPNFQPPAFRHVIQHDRRLWGISRDDPTLLWISKTLPAGAEMPGFPLQLVIRSEEGGAHVGLCSIGSQILAFKEEGIYVYSGSPPNDLLAGGNLSGPHPVALHTGCVTPKSICRCPEGVVFQSRDSFWLVDRGLSTKRIGGPVENQLATYPFCHGATLDQERECVYFAMANGDQPWGDNPVYGVTLVWHYMLNEWTVWHIPGRVVDTETGLTVVGQTVREPARSAAMLWRGSEEKFEYHQAQENGFAFYLDTNYQDLDGSYPRFKVSLPWIQPGGLAGYSRTRRAHLRGTRKGSHSLLVQHLYDFETEGFGSKTSLYFDGTSKHLAIGNIAALDFDLGDPFTVSVWFNTSGTGPDTLISKCLGAPSYQGWFLRIESTGKLRLWHVSNYATNNMYYVSTPNAVNDGKWHNAIVVDRGTTGADVEIYIDGVLVKAVVGLDSLTGATTSAANVYIGRATAGWYYQGLIDDVVVWDYDISASVALSVYGEGRPNEVTTTPKPVGYWRFDDCLYPTITDVGSGGNDGTMTNMVISDFRLDVPSGPSFNCFSATEVSALLDGTEEHIRIHIPQQKGKSIQTIVTASAAPGLGTGGNVRWETVAYEVGGKQGLFKLPQAGSR